MSANGKVEHTFCIHGAAGSKGEKGAGLWTCWWKTHKGPLYKAFSARGTEWHTHHKK